MESRIELSKNLGVCRARFSVLLFPHRDKERFVTTIERGATRIQERIGSGGARSPVDEAGVGSQRQLVVTTWRSPRWV
jgi:hypothetical protein